MKLIFIKLCIWLLLFSAALTSCGIPVEPTPAPQESESTTTTTTAETETTTSTTTTTTTTESTTTTATTTETTTTTSATTKAPTTIKTTKKTTNPTTSKTTEKTTKPTKVKPTKSTTKKATTTTKAPGPYDPYEVKKPLPAKNKRCLVLNVAGEDLEMAFDRTMVYPQEDDRLMWHYMGMTKKGITYTCVIVAENETIYKIFCDADSDYGFYSETDACLCIQQHLDMYQIPIGANNIDVTLSYSRAQVGANGENLVYTHGHSSVTSENKLGYFKYLIKLSDGMPFVHTFHAYSITDEGAIPGYSGDDIPLLIPRWKSE